MFGEALVVCNKMLRDLGLYILFYAVFIIAFSLLYQILGAEVDTSDYPDMNVFVVFFIQTFRNSVGDSSVPSYDMWK